LARRRRRRKREGERDRDRQIGLDKLCIANSGGKKQQLSETPKKETLSRLIVGDRTQHSVQKGKQSLTLLVMTVLTGKDHRR